MQSRQTDHYGIRLVVGRPENSLFCLKIHHYFCHRIWLQNVISAIVKGKLLKYTLNILNLTTMRRSTNIRILSYVNICFHGPLTRYVKLCFFHMSPECRERFPRHRLQRKPLVSDPVMHHRTGVIHVAWCMLGSLSRGGGENLFSRIPGACATRNFKYLAKSPWNPHFRHRQTGGGW